MECSSKDECLNADGKPDNKMCKINEELCGEWAEGIGKLREEYMKDKTMKDRTKYVAFLKELREKAKHGCILDKYCGHIGTNEAGEGTIFRCPDDNLTKMINHGRPMKAAAGAGAGGEAAAADGAGEKKAEAPPAEDEEEKTPE